MLEDISLESFFGLEHNLDLFQKALTPKSCGGGHEFKYLALIGDIILDLSFLAIMSGGQVVDSGFLTPEMKTFHNDDTLYQVAVVLKLNSFMIPTDANHTINEDEMKEAFEALLGASYYVHGFEKPCSIVSLILHEAELNGITLDTNYIGDLQEFAQKNKYPMPEYKYSENFGSDHEPIFYCTIHFLEYEVTSEPSNRKDKAKKNAAYKMLLKFGLVDENGSKSEIKDNKEIISKNVKQSIDQRSITFEKADIANSDKFINLESKTGETLPDWAHRKALKEPFAMLVLLSARVVEFSGSSWLADIESFSLVVMHLKYKEKQYFTIGFGQSRTKARKDAADRMIEEFNLFSILEENYLDTLI